MDTVGKLFGGNVRARLLRLFVFNPSNGFSLHEIAEHMGISERSVSHEIASLRSSKFIRSRRFKREVERKERGRMIIRYKQIVGWTINEKFPHLSALRDFLITAFPFSDKEVIRMLTRAGTLKLLVATGIFVENFESRVDLLVVGDALQKRRLGAAVKRIEAEVGREVRYAYFTTADFRYRYSLQDKLIRDIFDYSHRILVDRISFSN